MYTRWLDFRIQYPSIRRIRLEWRLALQRSFIPQYGSPISQCVSSAAWTLDRGCSTGNGQLARHRGHVSYPNVIICWRHVLHTEWPHDPVTQVLKVHQQMGHSIRHKLSRQRLIPTSFMWKSAAVGRTIACTCKRLRRGNNAFGTFMALHNADECSSSRFVFVNRELGTY